MVSDADSRSYKIDRKFDKRIPFLKSITSTETYSTNNYTEAFLLEQRIHKERKDERPYKAMAWKHDKTEVYR